MLGVSRLWWALRSRFKERYWMVDTKLPRYQYHECDTRMLYSMFSILENFVEVELRDFEHMWQEDYHGTGVDALIRQTKMVNDKASLWEGATDEDLITVYGEKANKPSDQSIMAGEVLDLYLWWKARPNRVYPIGEYSSVIDKYYEEDTQMLIKLIKVRGFLWT